MTTKVVADEQYGRVSRRAHELIARIVKGAVDFETAMKGLQFLIEGKEVGPIGATQDWLQKILKLERQCHLNFFGQEFDLTEFKETLKKYGRGKIRRWQKLGLESHFLPNVVMDRNDKFPGWKVKPEPWYYKKAEEDRILRGSINGELRVDKEPFRLEGITALIDTRLKPKYDGGKQMYKDDNLLGPLIAKLRQNKKISPYNYGPVSSRFGVSSTEWEEVIKPALAEKLGLEVNQVRLERAIEVNIVPQLYTGIPRRDDGTTSTWVWYEEYFEDRDSRLNGGSSDYGGLANVNYNFVGNHWNNKSLRSLEVSK